MKKTKKILIMSILAISTFILCGMTTVKADAFALKDNDIVCDPAVLEKGGRADCYIIGVPGDIGTSVNGYIVNAYTTKFLQIVSAKKMVRNSSAAWTDATSATATIAPTEDMPDALKSFSCAYDSGGIGSGITVTSYGCGAFYTIKNAENAFTRETIKNTGIKSGLLPNATYGVIGSITVQLDENTTGNECGEICVKVWRVPTESNYADYTSCGTTDEDNSNNCGSDSGGVYKCKEIHYNEDGQLAETGAFASYALLAACALVAISAIALSKKNNKFSRI